jgi:hypothetical protein
VPIIKPAQKHKYNTKTAQINKQTNKEKKIIIITTMTLAVINVADT